MHVKHGNSSQPRENATHPTVRRARTHTYTQAVLADSNESHSAEDDRLRLGCALKMVLMQQANPVLSVPHTAFKLSEQVSHDKCFCSKLSRGSKESHTSQTHRFIDV